MDTELKARLLMEAPTFGRSFRTAAKLSTITAEIAGKEDFPSDDFEFTFITAHSNFYTAAEMNADKMFNSGRIVDDGLKAKEEKLKGGIGLRSGLNSSSSSISSEGRELARLRGFKSKSMGSVDLESRGLSFTETAFGRSQSEGDEVLLLPASGKKKAEKRCYSLFGSCRRSAANRGEKTGKSEEENRWEVKELGILAAHRICSRRGIAGGGDMMIRDKRRCFLPYRQELIAGCFTGLFRPVVLHRAFHAN